MREKTTSDAVAQQALTRVLDALERGVPEDPETLARAANTTVEDARSVLAALGEYGMAVLAARRDCAQPTLDRKPLPNIEPETRLGDFVIEAEIGRGSMGTVYRARQCSLGGRLVALKVLPQVLVDRDPRFTARFRREALLASRIHHPHVAEVFDFDASGTAQWLAMRLVTGPTLHAELVRMASAPDVARRRDRPAHVRRCAELARDMADALAAIHAQGLVHRDVKPANIMLRRDGPEPPADLAGQAILVDFGLLRPAGDGVLTGTRTLLLTPAYASPEARLGDPLDGRADVFSLGAAIHDLLALLPPDARPPASAGLPDIRHFNSAVDERLAAVLATATQRRAEHRYADGAALRDDLDRYLRGDPVKALPSTGIARFRLWARRNPRRAIRIGLTLIASIALVVTVAVLGGWAIRLTRLANTALQLRNDGDLFGAEGAFRRLIAESDGGLLPWLADEREAAAAFLDPSRPMGRFVQGLSVGERLWAQSPEATSNAESELARAHGIACEIMLFGDPLHEGNWVRDFLLREVDDGVPEPRRRRAMTTWANTLISQESGPGEDPAMLATLIGRLRAQLDPLRSVGIHPATRRAAAAALGAIRSVNAFAAIVERILDDDPEVARLAATTSYHQVRWLNLAAPGMVRTLDRDLVTAWIESETLTCWRFGDAGASDAIASLVAWWEQDPEFAGCTSDRAPLLLGLQAREEVGRAHRTLADRWRQFADTMRNRREFSPDDPSWNYAVCAGRAVDRYDASIWRDDDGSTCNGILAVRTPNDLLRDDDPSRIDFPMEGDDRANPRLRGTLISAEVIQARVQAWPSRADGLGALILERPARSRLRVTTAVPTDANGFRIRIQHMIGVRPVLPDGGAVRFRLSIDGSAYEYLAPAPTGRRADDVDVSSVPLRVFKGRKTLIVDLDYVAGNTTYRIVALDLLWERG